MLSPITRLLHSDLHFEDLKRSWFFSLNIESLAWIIVRSCLARHTGGHFSWWYGSSCRIVRMYKTHPLKEGHAIGVYSTNKSAAPQPSQAFFAVNILMVICQVYVESVITGLEGGDGLS